MAVYFPKFEDVFVFRNVREPERYVTLVFRHRAQEDLTPPSVVISGVGYVYDEQGTERTRTHMQEQQERRLDNSMLEEIAIASSVE